MGLFQRLKHDLKTGWATLRLGTAQAATRALEETELLKLRLEARKLDAQLDDLHEEIGERAIELHDRGDSTEHLLADIEISRLVREVQRLRNYRRKLENEMDEVRNEP
jgi:hypothetical protein